MFRNSFLIFLIWNALVLLSYGQRVDHVQGEILVQLERKTDPSLMLAKMRDEGLFISIKKEVSSTFDVWLITFDFSQNDEIAVLEKIRRQPSIVHAQFNHFVKKRSTIPDDPLFSEQWFWQNLGQSGGTPGIDVDADLAWDLTTGGNTFDGHEIVVCVLEGTNRNHPDLQGNLWVNNAEIPNDGIDNDGNGYVDDYEGWNVNAQSDFINPEQHGTAVTGVIGAKGNNGMLLTGINWDVKIMHVDFANSVESDIVEAYTYPFLMRRKFNQTEGAQGALVVATNASWGIDGADPADFPIWCAVYDSLGSEGILNCVATSNDNVNVDDVGDMPGNCPSNYVINVTATDDNDIRNFAGYGTTHVDVAAPGEDMTLLNLNGGPLNDSGTSYAAPIVAGLVALLYSAPCSSFGKRSIADPVAMASMVRKAIYDGVDLRPNLADEVKTGGRVNAFSSLQILMENCTRCEQPFGLGIDTLTDTEAHVFWTSTDSTLTTNIRWRMLGNPLWSEENNISNPYLLEDLEACSEYEFQLEDLCPDTASGFTPNYIFETDGCCRAPENISINGITNNGGVVIWESVLAAQSYNLTLSDGMNTVTFENISANTFDLSGLSACTEYSAIIEVVCAGNLTDSSLPVFFTTNGCGTCLDTDYCPSESEDADGEWIANFSLNDIMNATVSDEGYGDYTHLSTDLVTWQNYELSITPGFENFEYDEWFVVWIDLNQDGAFDGPGEEVFNSNGTASTTVVGNILIPGTAQPGPTRMRVAMRFNTEPEACDAIFNFGEVEDYCVNIIQGVEPDCYPPTALNVPLIGNTFADLSWEDIPDANSFEIRIRPLSLPIWTVISTTSNEVTAINLEFCELHQFQVRAVCANEKSLWSPSANFMTGCFVSTNETNLEKQEMKVYPNPFFNSIWVEFFNQNSGEIEFQIVSPNGRVEAKNRKWFGAGEQRYKFDILGKELSNGIYFFKMKNGETTKMEKVILLN